MAFKKTVAERLFKISKITAPNSLQNCRISSSSFAVKSLGSANNDNLSPESGDDGIFRRFLHRHPEFRSPATLPELWSVSGEKLLEKFRGKDIVRERIRLDVLRPPEEETAVRNLTAEDTRKLLKLSQLEMVKLKLRKIDKNCISYNEFVEMCKTTSFGEDQGLEVAKLLDQSGTVIVLGNVVFIRPEQQEKLSETCVSPDLFNENGDL